MSDRSLAWRADAPAVVDALEFERLAASRHPADWQSAAQLYAGPLLPGTFDPWLLDERARLADLFAGLLARLASEQEARGAFAQAAETTERLLREAPFDEGAWLSLMRRYAAAGERARALEAFDRCRAALEDELGVEPGAELVALRARLTAAPPAPARAEAREAGGARLVGREAELARLQAWLHAGLGGAGPGLVLVEGEAGLGKTTLAFELAAWAREQGCVALWAQAYEPDRDLAFAPVRRLLQEPPLSAALATLPARWRHELARLAPELAAVGPEATEGRSDGSREQLFAALTGLLAGVDRPVLLVAEDLHWWDGASLAWLGALLAHHEPARLVVLAAVRPEAEWPAPVPPLLAALEARGALERTELRPLGREASQRLLEALTAERLPAAELDRAYAETEGNPLFLVEWLQAHQAGVAGEARSFEAYLEPLTQLPRRVHGLIMGRLLALSAEARRVAEAGAVLGRAFDWPALAGMTEAPDAELVDALDELCRRRVLRELPADAGGAGRYDFAHGRIRDVVEARLSAARRRFLHQRAAAALAAAHGDDERFAAQLGEHLALAGQPLEAARCLVRAGRAALRLFANEQAGAHHRRALELLGPDAGATGTRTDGDGERDAVRLAAWEGLGELAHLAGRHDEALAAFATAVAVDERLAPDPLRRARLLRRWADAERDAHRREAASARYDLAESEAAGAVRYGPDGAAARAVLLDIGFARLVLYYRAGRRADMERTLARLVPLVEEAADPRVHLRYHHTVAMLEHRRNRFVPSEEELRHARAALAAAERSTEPHLVARARFGLGFVELWAGELEAAEGSLTAGLAGAEATGDLLLEVRALTYLGVLARLRGDLEAAERAAARAGVLARSGGLREYVAAAHAQAAWAATELGRPADARREGVRALELWSESSTAFPFQWLAAVPMLGLAVAEGDLEAAAGHARLLTAPEQQRLPAGCERARPGPKAEPRARSRPSQDHAAALRPARPPRAANASPPARTLRPPSSPRWTAPGRAPPRRARPASRGPSPGSAPGTSASCRPPRPRSRPAAPPAAPPPR